MWAWAAFAASQFPKRSNEEEEDWTDVAGAVAALHGPKDDRARWRAALEAGFNVDGFLRWLALDTIIGNQDAFTPGNGYLYGSPRHRDRLFWIPWDNDTAMQSGTRQAGNPTPGGTGPSSVPIDLFHEANCWKTSAHVRIFP